MNSKTAEVSRTESREWWLSATAIVVTLLLTSGIVILTLSVNPTRQEELTARDLRTAVEGLVGVVLLFDLYVLYQRLQIHRLRQARRTDEELLSLIGENAADMIAVVDTKGQRQYHSPSFERVLGYKPEELSAASVIEYLNPDDRARVLEAAQEAQKGVAQTVEFRIRHKDGHWVQVESATSVTRDESGDVNRIIVVSRDIGDRKALEDKRIHAQRIEAVERLSAGIAHEFNNLLGVILAFADLLQMKLELNDSRYRDVEEIRLAGLRAAKLTKQLLAFSQQQTLNRTRLEVNEVILSLAPVLKEIVPEGVELIFTLQHDLAQISADRGQIEQLMLNMTVNAAEAMESGGVLQINTRIVAAREIKTADLTKGSASRNHVCLEMKDTGRGLDEHTRQRLFEPFFTTREQQSGLGLAVVFGIVKDNDGIVEVESNRESGTTFRMFFPAIESKGPLGF